MAQYAQSMMLDRLSSLQERWREEQLALRADFERHRLLWRDERRFLGDGAAALRREFVAVSVANVALQREVHALTAHLRRARLQVQARGGGPLFVCVSVGGPVGTILYPMVA